MLDEFNDKIDIVEEKKSVILKTWQQKLSRRTYREKTFFKKNQFGSKLLENIKQPGFCNWSLRRQ